MIDFCVRYIEPVMC